MLHTVSFAARLRQLSRVRDADIGWQDMLSELPPDHDGNESSWDWVRDFSDCIVSKYLLGNPAANHPRNGFSIAYFLPFHAYT